MRAGPELSCSAGAIMYAGHQSRLRHASRKHSTRKCRSCIASHTKLVVWVEACMPGLWFAHGENSVRIRRRCEFDPLTDDPRRSMPHAPQRTSPPAGWCSSNHWRTPFFATKPITRIRSSKGRSRYKRMIQPQTLQRSSHSASNSSHQQFSGAVGSAMSRWRVVSKMAAHTMVGTEYRAYTGVCSLAHAEGANSS